MTKNLRFQLDRHFHTGGLCHRHLRSLATSGRARSRKSARDTPRQDVVKFKQHVLPDDGHRKTQGHENKKARFRVSEVKRLAKSWRNDRLDYLKEYHGLTRSHVLKVPADTDIEQMVAEYMADRMLNTLSGLYR
jgi:hypothetical protein